MAGLVPGGVLGGFEPLRQPLKFSFQCLDLALLAVERVAELPQRVVLVGQQGFQMHDAVVCHGDDEAWSWWREGISGLAGRRVWR